MFLDKLEVIDEMDLGLPMDDNKYGVRHCEWLEVGREIYLSVQASYMHYCRPRELTDLKNYSHFELALIQGDGLSYDIHILNDFPRFDELESYWEGGVFAYVPKDLINDLYYWALEYFKEDK